MAATKSPTEMAAICCTASVRKKTSARSTPPRSPIYGGERALPRGRTMGYTMAVKGMKKRTRKMLRA